MNQYEKTAVFIIRLAAFTAFLYGSIGLINAIGMWLYFFSFPRIPEPLLWPSIVWAAVGTFGFALSKPLGRLIGKDL